MANFGNLLQSNKNYSIFLIRYYEDLDFPQKNLYYNFKYSSPH